MDKHRYKINQENLAVPELLTEDDEDIHQEIDLEIDYQDLAIPEFHYHKHEKNKKTEN